MARKLVAEADIWPGDLVLDVGAGDGVICEALLDAGARVLAIELHPVRAAALRARFADRDARVVMADAADLRLPRHPFRVVANPPFTVAMAVTRRLLAPGSRIVSADLVVPRHLAHRWRDERIRGGARWGRDFEISLGMRVPGRSFHPPIERDAVVLRIQRRLVLVQGQRR